MRFRESLFWDVNPRKINIQRNARYIIERILEFGQPDDIAWLFKQYSKKDIEKAMNLPRSQVGRKSKALWTLLLKK
jgi:hypothetical protein